MKFLKNVKSYPITRIKYGGYEFLIDSKYACDTFCIATDCSGFIFLMNTSAKFDYTDQAWGINCECDTMINIGHCDRITVEDAKKSKQTVSSLIVTPHEWRYVYGLIQGMESEKTIDLLFELTSIRDEKLICAIKYHLVDGATKPVAYNTYGVTQQAFSQALKRLGHIYVIHKQLCGE